MVIPYEFDYEIEPRLYIFGWKMAIFHFHICECEIHCKCKINDMAAQWSLHTVVVFFFTRLYPDKSVILKVFNSQNLI